jgi:hypothetical protein
MMVAAYDVTNQRDFFTATTFAQTNGQGTWKGGKFWPLSATLVTFTAIANANADNATGVSWGTNENHENQAGAVVITMSDNSSDQRDLMYAIGAGAVTQGNGNALTFPGNIGMSFYHAQALIDFKVKAASSTETIISVDSIRLNNAAYSGTFLVEHMYYNQTSGQQIYGEWQTTGSRKDLLIPNASPVTLSANDWQTVGDSLMVVPNSDSSADYDSFTIYYSFGGNAYDYTYVPDSRDLAKATHYTFKITFKLHEIEVEPQVVAWDSPNESPITIQE